MGSGSQPNQSTHPPELALDGLCTSAINLGRWALHQTPDPYTAQQLASSESRQRLFTEILWRTYELCFKVCARQAGVPADRLESVDWWQDCDPRSRVDLPKPPEPVASRCHEHPDERLKFFDYASAYPALLAQSQTITDRILDTDVPSTRSTPRRSRGAFYTPTPLIEHILQSAVIEPLDQRLRASGVNTTDQRENIVRNFRICDPTVGVGGFLIRAAHHLASRLDESNALTEIIANNLYGVDIDPLAVTLCRAVLWLETPASPCEWAALCSHIKVGNSLIGATPELISKGIPNDAFRAGPGDSPQAVRYYRTRNRAERRTMQRGIVPVDPKLAADAWCAAFVWRKHDTDRPGLIEGCPGRWDAITQRVFEQIQTRPDNVPPWILAEIARLSAQYHFFHWHHEFPEVIHIQH